MHKGGVNLIIREGPGVERINHQGNMIMELGEGLILEAEGIGTKADGYLVVEEVSVEI